MPLSRYLKIYPCPDRPGTFLLYSTKKGSVARISATLLEAARNGNLTETAQASLNRLGILVADPDAEQREMAAIVRRSNSRSRKCGVLAILTLDCNLVCPYCYEEHYRGTYGMTVATARLLVDFLEREHIAAGRDVELDFYGGEALLALPLIREIATPLRDATRKAGTKFSFSLVTNGTLLTRSLVTELLPLGLKGARVTLDGPPHVHDLQRPFLSGKGSFATIIANLREIAGLIELQLGGNCTPDNYREFPPLLDILLDEGITPDKVSLIQFGPIVPKSGRTITPEAPGGCISSAEPWLRDAGLFLRAEILKRGFTADRPTMAACCVEFANDLVVNYDGTLFKCPAFVGWPELAVGTLTEGVGDYAASHNLAIWHNDECLDCAYLPLCFGGCRYLDLLKNGRIVGVDCRRDFYDATLEETIRQDLMWRPSPGNNRSASSPLQS
jgi:uncharacterized protein